MVLFFWFETPFHELRIEPLTSQQLLTTEEIFPQHGPNQAPKTAFFKGKVAKSLQKRLFFWSLVWPMLGEYLRRGEELPGS